jgi:hypothetical protein
MALPEDNKLEIELAQRTMELVGRVVVEASFPSESKAKVRSILATLCDFQNRFAEPMYFSVEQKNDDVGTAPQRLPTPRPLKILLDNAVVAPIGL